MPPSVVARVQRRKRQDETLRKMLEAVELVLAAFDQIEKDRSLTEPERVELDTLRVRRQRIADSISEAGQAGPGA
jgi:hypothetical protein